MLRITNHKCLFITMEDDDSQSYKMNCQMIDTKERGFASRKVGEQCIKLNTETTMTWDNISALVIVAQGAQPYQVARKNDCCK